MYGKNGDAISERHRFWKTRSLKMRQKKIDLSIIKKCKGNAPEKFLTHFLEDAISQNAPKPAHHFQNASERFKKWFFFQIIISKKNDYLLDFSQKNYFPIFPTSHEKFVIFYSIC